MAALLVDVIAYTLYCLLTTDFSARLQPELSVVVDGVSGLDSRVPRSFNLSLSIDNVGLREEECVAGEAVVLYGGVPLATGAVQNLCVPPNRAGKVSIFAVSGGVGLPTDLAELMADEKRDGGAVRLEVRVMSLKYSRFLRCTPSLHGGAGPQPPCNRLTLGDESDGVRKVLVF
uniref:Late embryogenesis abundant protein LEA-2 subgroup domain-containing protein n=1 Tax=Hordeum vulgare subsp. vulgare TaxID=112509 RepID=A0A8I6XA51_HORVV